MNNSELYGRVIRVNFARPQRFKEGYHRPIWMEEDFYKRHEAKDKENNEGEGETKKINNNQFFQ